MKIKLAWLYPDLMDTYGDRGNIVCLLKRCAWRGLEVDYRELSLGESLDGDEDLVFMGGAQDRQQKYILEDLQVFKAPKLRALVEEGVAALLVCAAFQLMGHYYQLADGNKLEGLGIFDMFTEHPGMRAKRLIGNVVVQELGFGRFPPEKTLVGFENHGGRTFLGKDLKPLGRVRYGFGNNGEDKSEGVVYRGAVGTYLHGPVLPKNPHLADFLIETALAHRYHETVELTSLEDTEEWRAHEAARKIAARRG